MRYANFATAMLWAFTAGMQLVLRNYFVAATTILASVFYFAYAVWTLRQIVASEREEAERKAIKGALECKPRS